VPAQDVFLSLTCAGSMQEGTIGNDPTHPTLGLLVVGVRGLLPVLNLYPRTASH
jgi:hypothetical protein